MGTIEACAGGYKPPMVFQRHYQRIVFQVNWESGEKWLLVNHPDVTVDKVVEDLKYRYPDSKFKVGQIDVGAFRLATPCVPDKEVVFRSDTRWVTQDGEIE